MDQLSQKYPMHFSDKDIRKTLDELRSEAKHEHHIENLKRAFSLIDLTSLNATDTDDKVKIMAQKVSDVKHNYPNIPNVAAICVYPPFIKIIRENVTDNNVKIASVGAGFPSSQTFKSIKIEECRMAKKAGADDIDIVIPLGKYVSGNLDFVYEEISEIKEAIGDTHLKVILETGALPETKDIWLASFLAMEAGADFIKTSTGKLQPAATPEAIFVMSMAIKMYYSKTGKKVGIKPAGGISTASDAMLYLSIVKNILGDEWIQPDLFRIGASRLANNLLTEIAAMETGKKNEIQYF